jgi:hypothetical protein
MMFVANLIKLNARQQSIAHDLDGTGQRQQYQTPKINN